MTKTSDQFLIHVSCYCCIYFNGAISKETNTMHFGNNMALLFAMSFLFLHVLSKIL